MLDWHEFVAKEHQKELLREAERQCLTRELRAARWDERLRPRNPSQKRSLRATRHQGNPCPGPGGI